MYDPCDNCNAKGILCGQCKFHFICENYNEAMRQIVELAKKIGEREMIS